MRPALSPQRRRRPIAVLAALILVLATLGAVPPAATAQTAGRTISGALLYRDKIALPDGAEMVVELRAPNGVLVARLRRKTEGAQVPLPFSMQGPANAPLFLRAALFDNARPLWASAPVALRAGRGPLIAPPVILSRIEAAGFATPLSCGKARAEITFVPGGAWLGVAGKRYHLLPDPEMPSRLKAESDAGIWFESLGTRATIHLKDRKLSDCAPEIAPPLFPLKAGGNEPGWHLDMGNGRLILSQLGGEKIAAPLPLPTHGDKGESLHFDLPDQKLALTVTRALCHDAATGMPHPLTVKVTTADRNLQGCGGAPMALLEGPAWTITRAGSSDLAGSGAEISFLGNQASGRAPCNRFSARLRLTEGLRFGPIAATRMTCAAMKMTAEEALFNALGATDGFDIVGGQLQLLARGKVVLSASR